MNGGQTQQFLNDEAFDTDGILQDIEEKNAVNSNIASYLRNEEEYNELKEYIYNINRISFYFPTFKSQINEIRNNIKCMYYFCVL